VAHGNTLTVQYDDADDGTGSPATVYDNAGIDCVLPVISNVRVQNVQSCKATVTYDTDEPAFPFVPYGVFCAESLAAWGTTGISHSVDVGGLFPGGTYTYWAEATDRAGNWVRDDSGGLCYSLTTSPEYFTELFSAKNLGDEGKGAELNEGSYDLSNQSLTFTPGGPCGFFDFYDVCQAAVSTFPTDPSGGTVLSLLHDDFGLVTLTGGTVSLYGVNYSEFYVGSNGYITFGTGDADPSETLVDHFDLPRISGLFDDLSPFQAGTVSWKELPDRAAVTWEGVTEKDAGNQNSFQIEMFFDDTIVVTYLSVAAQDGLAGLSEGLGYPLDFISSDLSAYASCCDCPNQGDIEPDGFITALDLSACIDILFGGAEDVQDEGCPSPKFDLDCDGFSTALDLSALIDHLFVGGPGPCDPCSP
jgi:hypothetical protein